MLLVIKMGEDWNEKEIPVAVLRNNFINGIDNYNYEKFMVDFINNSKLIDAKGGVPFWHQEEQSNSEADAFNGLYDIDFKILCEPEQMHARTSTGMRIFKTKDGNIAYSLANNKQEMGYYNMMRVFIKWPRILTDGYKIGDDKLLKAVNVIKKLLATNKNIIILLPFEYYFNECQTDENIAKEIIKKFNVPFNAMREYRITQTQCDLYFIFKSKGYMVIVDANKDVCFYDMVPYSCSDLFDSLFRIGHFWPVIDE